MRKVVRLTESDLMRIVKRVINEQQNEELLTEGLSDIINKIKSKFPSKKEKELVSDLKNGLNIDEKSTKQEVINAVKNFFGGFSLMSKEEIIDNSKSLGQLVKYFTYYLLLVGASEMSERDPLTFLALGIYVMIQKTDIKFGDKRFRFKD
jgi:hypothetical protein